MKREFLMFSCNLLKRVALATLVVSSTAATSYVVGEESAQAVPIVDQQPWDGTLSDYFDDEGGEPWITVRAGALTLHKSDNQSHVLLSDQATGQPYLTTSDTTPGWTAGAEIDFFLRLSDDLFFEFDWFTIGAWSRQHNADLNGATVNIGFPIDGASFATNQQFKNYEFNLRRRLTDDFTVLAGFRYIELNDAFHIHYDASSAGITEDGTVGAFNRLYGFQIGSQGTFLRYGGWQLDGWVKSGIFGNSAGNSTQVVLNGVGVTLPPFEARKSDASFVGDLGLRASRQLGNHIQLYGGYRIMFVDGVALGANQYNNVSTFFSGAGPVSMVTNGSQFYHGAELGLIFSY